MSLMSETLQPHLDRLRAEEMRHWWDSHDPPEPRRNPAGRVIAAPDRGLRRIGRFFRRIGRFFRRAAAVLPNVKSPDQLADEQYERELEDYATEGAGAGAEALSDRPHMKIRITWYRSRRPEWCPAAPDRWIEIPRSARVRASESSFSEAAEIYTESFLARYTRGDADNWRNNVEVLELRLE